MSYISSSDEETDFKEISSTNYQRVQEKVAKISYADGIADGREKVFQESFDEGFEDGFKTGFELAKFSGFYETLKNAEAGSLELTTEQELYQLLKLADATDKTHFKYLEHQGEPLNVISEKQRTYVDDLLVKFDQQLPATTNLFSSGSDSSVNVV
ncbi:putative tRNA 2'-phosphotransferase [Drosophila rhopaloa]|uniref:Essential protein Yae1 N-terminal domain-containing protein n=1 Tax=Drosophila rhopaloa TaxID=1041015 RepID=A0ABM5HD29_DRORH|nr:putative tRNA 2'-phosphotransferase [Drosophila rhopaloa]